MRRKVLIPAVMIICLVILFVLVGLLTRQTQGKLIIQTNDLNDKVYLISNSNPKKVLIGTGTHINSAVGSGQYLIQAVDQQNISQTVAAISPKTTTSVSLNLVSAKKPQEVINFWAQDLSISGSDIRFLNEGVQQIFEYNSASGAEQTIASDLYPVEQVLWINHQQAIAIDNLYNPYLVNGQSDSPISLVTTKIGDNLVVEDFAVNSSGDFAYAQNGNVYLSRQGKITKLSQDTSLEMQIRLAVDDTVFINGIKPLNPNITTIDVGVATKSTAYFITTSGQKISYPGSETIDQAAWSPDSQNIAVSTSKDLTIYNYKTKQIVTVTLHGANPSGSFSWIDVNHLMYVDQSTIWEYDLSQNTSYKIAKAPGNINHAVPFAVADNGIVYFSTDPTDELGTGAAIYKISP